MRNFTPSAERENEALWGNKDGFEAHLKNKGIMPLTPTDKKES